MRLLLPLTLALTLIGFSQVNSQRTMATPARIKIVYISRDVNISDLNDSLWSKAADILIGKYWSGINAPEGRHFSARLLWSDNALFVRFEANHTEPLFVSERPDLTKKVLGLWDRDVCEIFIAPNAAERNKYFEFEIAPTGEWIDLGIKVTPSKRLTDWDYKSGMESSVKIEKGKVVMAIKIGWKALGKSPKARDIWLGNLFRCVGKDPTRGYLSWRATKTKEPSFHVPKAFGEFEFVK